MKMKTTVLAILPVAFLLASANAEEFDASLANDLPSGRPDLASLDYWKQMGKDRLPQSADMVKLSGRATENPYCASDDLSIYNILFSVSGSYIDLTTDDGSIRTVTLNSSGNAMEFSSGSAGYRVKGGKWHLVNKGDVYCGRSNSTSQDRHTIEFNACIVTNADRFYGAYCDRHTIVNIVNGAEIYADGVYPSYGNYATNSRISVTGGSKLVSFGRMIQGDGASEVTEVGDNIVDVCGCGADGPKSLLNIDDKSILGHKVPHNTLQIRDGAKLESGAIFIGNQNAGHSSRIAVSGAGTEAYTGNLFVGNAEKAHGCGFFATGGVDWYSTGQLQVGVASCGNCAELSASTGSCGLVSLGVRESSSDNAMVLDSASKLVLRNGLMFEVGVTGSCNRVEIKGGSVVAFSDDGWFVVGKEASSTGNVLRMAGAGTTISFTNVDAFDPFGFGCGNSIVLEDDMVLNGGQYNFAFNSSANRFTVRNATLNSGMHSHMGVGKLDNDGCRGNTLELLDGAAASFLSFSMSAFDNTLFVSNSTFYADDPSRGMRIGYLSSDALAGCASNNTVWVAGESAGVETTGTLSFSNFSRLHFSIPRKGWSSAPVRALRMTCGANTVITADCEEFCNYTGGGIVLVETVNGIDDKRIDAVLATANAKLPPNARFYVSGNNLMFRAPHVKGTVVVVR
jgi:hypothetical protein